MKTYFLCKLVGVTLLLQILSCNVHAQEGQSDRGISTERYHQVIDLLFPLDELKNKGQRVTVLRFEPSFTAESQIVMIERDGYFQIYEYKSLDGNLFYKLDGMSGISNLSPAEIARKVRVSKRELRIPYARAQLWRKNLLASVYAYARPKTIEYIPSSDSVTVMSDGTSYELWDTWGWDLHFQFQGETTHKGAPPLEASFIRWMNVVRQEVTKQE